MSEKLAAPPRVCVIIPAFNEGPLLREAVASVVEQEPVELVIVDDGSTDERALETLDRLRAEGVQVVRRENGGPPVARNTGLASTSAPLVQPLDSDDLLVPGVLGELADLLEQHPDAGFAWGDYAMFGERTGRYRAPDRFLPWSTTYVNLYPPCSMLRRSALEAVGGWQEPRGYEDWGLWLSFLARGIDGVSSRRVVYWRRYHGSGRLLPSVRPRHRALYSELKRRHPVPFARRGEARRRERPPRWKRVLYPLLFGPRLVVPVRLEAALTRTRAWQALRTLRR